MTKCISAEEDMPEPGIEVSVYSVRDKICGYAYRFKNEWRFNQKQQIEWSPISHWWHKPELPEDE